MPGPALAAALRATTPEVLRTANAYDALVIGAGAAGGLAALLLAEAGLRVLVLEAGRARAPGSRSRVVSPLLEPVALENSATTAADPVSLSCMGVRPRGIRR